MFVVFSGLLNFRKFFIPSWRLPNISPPQYSFTHRNQRAPIPLLVMRYFKGPRTDVFTPTRSINHVLPITPINGPVITTGPLPTRCLHLRTRTRGCLVSEWGAHISKAPSLPIILPEHDESALLGTAQSQNPDNR